MSANQRLLRLSLAFLLLSLLALQGVALEAWGQNLFVIPFFRKSQRVFDPYYGQTVWAYREGAEARVDVLIFNAAFFGESKIVEVNARFGWMERGLPPLPSEQCTRLEPCILKAGELIYVPIMVELPNATEINREPQSYEIRIVELFEDGTEQVSGTAVGIDLAVYSNPQADAIEAYTQAAERLGLNQLNLQRPSTPPPIFTTAEASVIARRAVDLALKGLDEYREGNFEEALSLFKESLATYDEALAKEEEIGSSLRRAEIEKVEVMKSQAEAEFRRAAALESQAEAFRSEAEALSRQAEALSEQASAFDRQAQALEAQALQASRQVEAMESQARAMERQSEALEAQARAMESQARAFSSLALGLTIGTILIGAGVILYAILGRWPKPKSG